MKNNKKNVKKKKRRGTMAILSVSLITLSIVVMLWVIPNMHVTGKGTGREKATITLSEADVKPPVFAGVTDRTFYLGDVVTYLEGVSAVDEVDGQVDIHVDNAEVDINTPGIYKVYYTAIDKSGNAVMETAQFSFTSLPGEETYQELALMLVEQVTDETMTIQQKIKVLYDYLYGRMYYGASYDGEDWKNEARLVLRRLLNENGSINGDCFTSASLAKAVLEAVGADARWLHNYGAEAGITNHVWILCNVGTGWYHFDLTHFDTNVQHFMVTDADLEEYMKQYNKQSYHREVSAYPATPQISFEY